MSKHTEELKLKFYGRKHVWAIINNTELLRDAAFISADFLLGTRVSELVGGTVTHKIYIDDENELTYNSWKKVPDFRKQYVRAELVKKRLDPLRVYAWERTKKYGQEFVQVVAPVLKSRKWPPNYSTRLIPVNEEELPFIEIVEGYLKGLKRDAVMFPFDRYKAKRILRDASKKVQGLEKEGWNLHYLRHLRHRILASDYGLDVPQLKAFSGWTTDIMPSYYAKQNTRDVATRMIQAKRGGA